MRDFFQLFLFAHCLGFFDADINGINDCSTHAAAFQCSDCFNAAMTPADQEIVLQILNSFGKAEVVPESLMDTVTGVSGSSPAYVYMFIEAMADAAVLHGMPRAQAYTFAAQSVLGSAKMVLETGMHPGALKDNVCSPGGTTIEAVAALESSGMRAAVIDAIDVCVKKSKAMSK